MKSIGSKVWIIDDDPAYQTCLITYLKNLGCSAKVLSKDDEEFTSAKEKPDVIIRDLQLQQELNVVNFGFGIPEASEKVPVIYLSQEEKNRLLNEAASHVMDGNDCESLNKLKSRINKIQKARALKRKRARYRTLIYSVVAIFWSIGLYFFLNNISI